MDNKDSFVKFVEIVVNKFNEKIKVGDILTILQVVSKSVEDDVDIKTVNTIILGIITGLATKLDPDKTDKILDNYMNNIKEKLS